MLFLSISFAPVLILEFNTLADILTCPLAIIVASSTFFLTVTEFPAFTCVPLFILPLISTSPIKSTLPVFISTSFNSYILLTL